MTKIKKPATTQDTEDQLKRALADYRNLERRIEEERRLLTHLAASVVIAKLLPILDDLENAQKHLNDQGLSMVIAKFKDILVVEGIEEIAAVGATFDPNLHEATEVVGGEKDNIVVKVVRKGYKVGDKVLRPAQVVVERKGDSGQALRLHSGQLKGSESYRTARMTEDPPLTSHPRVGEDQTFVPRTQSRGILDQANGSEQVESVENDTGGNQI